MPKIIYQFLHVEEGQKNCFLFRDRSHDVINILTDNENSFSSGTFMS